jgi:hypothetical protein
MSPTASILAWAQDPIHQIEAAKGAKPRIDLCLAAVRSVGAAEKLRTVCDLASPCLATREGSGPWRHPKNRRATARHRTYKVPLAPPEMAWARLQCQILNAVAQSDFTGSPVFVPYIKDNVRAGDLLARVVVRPRHGRGPFGARREAHVSRQAIDVEL